MFVSLADKKKFLQWLVTTIPFSRREILWILNYLLRHEAILNKIHFVEQVEKTKRGIRVAAEGMAEAPITLFLSGKSFEDTDQIFHEIRMNWQEILYLECIFPEAWTTSEYLAILEDNPYARWNDQVDPEVVTAVETYFTQEEQHQQLALLRHQIDQALENSDYEAFLELTTELNRLKSR
jgi:uncharacterized protein YpiB (UPF0302 family)